MKSTKKRSKFGPIRTFYLVSLGCAKNLVDSEAIIDSLMKCGYTWVTDENQADAVVINTCCFINEARQEAIDTILEYVEKKKKRDFKIVAGGCLAQRFGDKVMKLLPEVNGWFGIDGCFTLPGIFDVLSRGGKKSSIREPSRQYDEYEGRERVTPRAWRYIKIAEGCSHHCTFCVIPPIRGPYRSRRIEDIVAEARGLAEEGCRELILIAQDTGVYGSDLYGRKRLPELLTRLHEIDGIQWLRLLYINPHSMDDELIQAVASNRKIVKYLDIPFQHSVERILGRMGRPGGEERFLELLDRIRRQIPGLAVRSSFIVGFPGESAAEFDQLCTFIQKARLNRAGFFTYSREEGTGASRYAGQVHHATQKKRFREIMALQQGISREVNSERLGRTIPVIIDKKTGLEDYDFLKGIAGELGNFLITGEPGKKVSYLGRTAWDAPDIDGVALISGEKTGKGSRKTQPAPGEILQVEVRVCTTYDVAGYQAETT